MGRLSLMIMVGCVAIYALQMAILAFMIAFALMVVAGLIFRTKETIGLIAVAAIMALFRAFPLPAIIVAVVLVVVMIIVKAGEGGPERPTALLEAPEDNDAT